MSTGEVRGIQTVASFPLHVWVRRSLAPALAPAGASDLDAPMPEST